jgi:hypothetical protein
MPAIIGYNVPSSDGSFGWGLGSAIASSIVATYTAGPGDYLTRFGVFGYGSVDGTHLTVALYVFDGVHPTAKVTGNYDIILNTTTAWYYVDIVPFGLTNGVTYCLAWSGENAGANTANIWYANGVAPGRFNSLSVTLTNPFGWTGVDSGRHYSIYADVNRVAINTISPQYGLPGGGKTVTITGSGFIAGTTVSFGGSAAGAVTIIDQSTLTCVTTAHAAGLVNVVVTAPYGSATVTVSFYYRASIPSIQPFISGCIGTFLTPDAGELTFGAVGKDSRAPLANGGIWDGWVLPADNLDSAQLVMTSGAICGLFLQLSAVPNIGNTRVFTLYVNGVSTALTITIGAGDLWGHATQMVLVSKGDYIDLVTTTPSGAAQSCYTKWSSEFHSDNPAESLLPICAYGGAVDGPGTYYCPIYSGANNNRDAENKVWSVCPTAGTIKNLGWKVLDHTSFGSTYTITLRKNGVDTALTITFVSDNTAKYTEDLVHSVAVAAGDILDLKVVIVGAGGTQVGGSACGMVFTSAIDGESLLIGGTYQNLNNAGTNYAVLTLGRGSEIWKTPITSRLDGAHSGFTLKNLYMALTVAPGGATSYVFTVLKNGTVTTMTVTIAGAATTGNDLLHTITPADYDTLAIQNVPSGAVAASQAFWGLVGYLPTPAGPPPAAKSSLISRLIAMGQI